VDKVVEELLHPIAKRLAATSVGALVIFWGIGLALFHFYHPQPFLICRTGGADLCGLLSGDTKRTTIAALCLVVAVAATSLAVFSQATDATRFLTGGGWHRLRQPGVRLQAHARRRATNRAFPGWEHPPKAPGSPLRASKDGLGSWLRYPYGSSRHEPEDPPLLPDVPLAPTLLGNVFAASRQRVLDWDGLSLHSGNWQALLSVLEERDLATLRAEWSDLLLRTQTVIFCVATAVWAVWLPDWQWQAFWVPAWLAVAYVTYRRVCHAASRYCVCIEAIIPPYLAKLCERYGFPPLMVTIDEQQKRRGRWGVSGPYAPPNLNMISLRRKDVDN
jgi:hypothetical protein